MQQRPRNDDNDGDDHDDHVDNDDEVDDSGKYDDEQMGKYLYVNCTIIYTL